MFPPCSVARAAAACSMCGGKSFGCAHGSRFRDVRVIASVREGKGSLDRDRRTHQALVLQHQRVRRCVHVRHDRQGVAKGERLRLRALAILVALENRGVVPEDGAVCAACLANSTREVTQYCIKVEAVWVRMDRAQPPVGERGDAASTQHASRGGRVEQCAGMLPFEHLPARHHKARRLLAQPVH
eukprot:5904907-Prymnesium_polylepis.1